MTWLALAVDSSVSTLATVIPVLAASVTATVTLIVGLVTWRQKLKADRKTAWWARVSWAVDKSVSDNMVERCAGLVALKILADPQLSDSSDRRLLNEVAVKIIELWRAK